MINTRQIMVIATAILLFACGSKSGTGTADIDTRPAPSDVTARQTDGVGDVGVVDHGEKSDVADVVGDTVADLPGHEIEEVEVTTLDVLVDVAVDIPDILADVLEVKDETAGSDAGPEVVEVLEDVSCIPACSGKECGMDGCGGNCGICPEDGDPCTVEWCLKGGSCTSSPTDYCCDTDLDCDDDGKECSEHKCSQGKCVHIGEPDPIVCIFDYECEDCNLCTKDACLGDVCEHEKLVDHPMCGECTSSSDCDDGVWCKSTTCVGYKCHEIKGGGEPCSEYGYVYPCDSNPCSCDHPEIGNCAKFPPWTAGFCATQEWPASCCAHDAGCDDGNACTDDYCSSQLLTKWRCLSFANDDNSCDDGNPLTDDWCVDGACVNCKPDCGSKECGDDGCGGSCGACLPEAVCEAGQCVDS